MCEPCSILMGAEALILFLFHLSLLRRTAEILSRMWGAKISGALFGRAVWTLVNPVPLVGSFVAAAGVSHLLCGESRQTAYISPTCGHCGGRISIGWVVGRRSTVLREASLSATPFAAAEMVDVFIWLKTGLYQVNFLTSWTDKSAWWCMAALLPSRGRAFCSRFYPRDALLARYVSWPCSLSVRRSVCPSQAGVLPKRMIAITTPHNSPGTLVFLHFCIFILSMWLRISSRLIVL